MTIVPRRGIMGINTKFLSPCGLYCGVCGIYYATRDNNPKFLEKLLNFYQNAMPGLENLTINDLECEGCLSDNISFFVFFSFFFLTSFLLNDSCDLPI